MNQDLLAKIQAERQKRLENDHLDVDVPSWSGRLVARYEVLTDEDELLQAVQASSSIEQFIDFLLKACSGLYLRDDAGELEPLEDEHGVVGYDRIAAKLELDAESARAALRNLFGENVVAISTHAMRVFGWMQDTSRGGDRGLLGES